MYLTFYNLKAPPFHITPDPKFLYLSPSHKEALAAIIYGIEQRKGFVAIMGGIGVGKTTILRSYLQTAQKKRLKIVYVFNARLTFQELLKAMYRELELAIESDDTTEMADRLYEFLIEEYQQGNTVVLVIDEAQNMPVDTLESLRMLSNFETPTDKLIQIVLVGQLEFKDLLDSDKLRPLNQRLVIRSTILPLTKKESLEYIKFRLSKVGSSLNSVLTASALKKIVATSQGIPRILNVLCDNALITGFGYRQKPITKKVASEIIRDFKGVRTPRLVRWWMAGILALVLLSTGITSFLPYEEAALSRIKMIVPGEQSAQGVVAKQSEKPPARVDQRKRSSEGGQAPSSVTNEPAGVRKVVNRGDSLSRLAQEVYGHFDAELISLIRKENPHIKNPNLIMVGSTVTFPKADGPGERVDQ